MDAIEYLPERAWKHPECYGGFSPDGDYLILSRHRDSDILSESNWAVACDACVAHGAFDQDSSTCVSIGKPDRDYDGREPVEPATVLRANTSLERYVRKNYLR